MKTLELKPKRFSQSFSVRAADDPASRVLTFTIATERVALDDGVLLADGADFARYLENPIVFSDHKGTCESKVGKTIAIRRIPGGWESDIEFAPAEVSDDAERVFRFLKWSGFGAVSIGFIVTRMNRDPSPELRAKYALPKYGWIGETWQLLETSVVGVGADPGALAHMAGPKGRAMRQAYTEAFLRKWEATKTTAPDVRLAEPLADPVAPVETDTTTTGTIEVTHNANTSETTTTEHAATPPTIETEAPMESEDESQSENDQTSLMFSMVFEAIQQLGDKLDVLCEKMSTAAVGSTEAPRSVVDWDKLEALDERLSRSLK